MKRVQVIITCLLLQMTFDLIAAQLLPKRRSPTCPEGYFVVRNGSVRSHKWSEGVQCKQCTDCSAADRDTLVKCLMFADSLCGNRSIAVVTSTQTRVAPPVPAPEVWIIFPVIVLVLVLIIITLSFTLMSCRKQQQNKLKGMDPL